MENTSVLDNKKFAWQFRQMDCGLWAGIISFRSESDMDVIFQDGSVAEHQSLADFMSGKVRIKERNKIVSFDAYVRNRNIAR